MKRGILTDKYGRMAIEKTQAYIDTIKIEEYPGVGLNKIVESNIIKEFTKAVPRTSREDNKQYITIACRRLEDAIAQHNLCILQPDDELSKSYVTMKYVTEKWDYDYQFNIICDRTTKTLSDNATFGVVAEMDSYKKVSAPEEIKTAQYNYMGLLHGQPGNRTRTYKSRNSVV